PVSSPRLLFASSVNLFYLWDRNYRPLVERRRATGLGRTTQPVTVTDVRTHLGRRTRPTDPQERDGGRAEAHRLPPAPAVHPRPPRRPSCVLRGHGPRRGTDPLPVRAVPPGQVARVHHREVQTA